MKHHLYLSPHLDDAVFSCGGCILQQTAQGDRVTVLTVFAGDPPQGPLSSFAQALHERWEVGREGVAIRRAEDRMACARLDATAVHLEFPEAIYRRNPEAGYLYTSEEAIFGAVHPLELEFVVEVFASIRHHLHESLAVYAPLGLGGHVDHRFLRRVVDLVHAPVVFYPDFPYVARGLPLPEDLPIPGSRPLEFSLDAVEIQAWIDALCEYQTQLSTFWPSYDELLAEMESYIGRQGGITMYRAG